MVATASGGEAVADWQGADRLKIDEIKQDSELAGLLRR